VIWTRHRRAPDLTPRLREWFAHAGFKEVAFGSPDASGLRSVGVHRLTTANVVRSGTPRLPAERLFTFADPADGPAHA
jgi:hypothetical protein